MTGTLTDALLTVHGILVEAQVPHALCGGLAANLYRDEVRATADVDLAIVVAPAKTVRIVQLLEQKGWKVEPYWRHGEQLRLSRPDLPRVDCIMATTDFERSAIERSIDANVEGDVVAVLTPEDLIVFKLVAGRARDYEAVAAIINTLGERIDTEYVKGWLEQFGIEDTWARAIEEASRESER